MDKIDQDILRALKKNPIKPFLSIAEEIGISTTTALNRYEKMKKNGTIYGVVTIIDLSKIGYRGKAFLLVTNNAADISETTLKALSTVPNVFLISEIFGTFDLLAMAAFKDLSEIKEIIDDIRAFPSVKKVEVVLTTDTLYPVKEEYKDMQLFSSENAESS
jgi:Lrp/AsnC family leucine-responsive transcriptional regulator